MTTSTPDIQAFKDLIDNLDIQLSRSTDGVYTVCTTAEPLFCYDADTPEELAGLVNDTIVSYAKHFYQIDLPQIDTKAVFTNSLPVERSTPVGRFKPVFDLAA